MTVPEVVTTASDALAARVRPGRLRVSVPALLTVPGEQRPAWLEVNGQRGPVLTLAQGVPQRLTASAVVQPGAIVTVRLLAGGVVVATWHHAAR